MNSIFVRIIGKNEAFPSVGPKTATDWRMATSRELNVWMTVPMAGDFYTSPRAHQYR